MFVQILWIKRLFRSMIGKHCHKICRNSGLFSIQLLTKYWFIFFSPTWQHTESRWVFSASDWQVCQGGQRQICGLWVQVQPTSSRMQVVIQWSGNDDQSTSKRANHLYHIGYHFSFWHITFVLAGDLPWDQVLHVSGGRRRLPQADHHQPDHGWHRQIHMWYPGRYHQCQARRWK